MAKINLSKPIIKLYKPDSNVKLFSLKIPENKAGELNINIRPDEDGYGYRYITELKNKYNKVLGFEKFAMFEDSDKISGLYISVNPEYRRQNYFLGEILRLTSLIEMLENKVKELKITSKSSAIFFHSKYKFKPDITSFKERDMLLKTVLEDKNPKVSDISDKAKKLIDNINQTKSSKEQREFCKMANQILEEYISKILADKNAQRPDFNWTMDMVLKNTTLQKNGEFFNKLFEKHGIDYKI